MPQDAHTKLRERLSATTEMRERIHVLNEFARDVYRTDAIEAEACAQEALQLTTHSDFADLPQATHATGASIALTTLCLINQQRGAYPLALEQGQQALYWADVAGAHRQSAHALRALGTVQATLGDYAESLASHMREYEISQQIDDPIYRAAALNSIATIYARTNNVADARETYEQSLAIRRQLHDAKAEMIILSNLAALSGQTEAYQAALDYATQSLRIAEEQGIVQMQVNNLLNIARAHICLDQHAAALQAYERLIPLAQAQQMRVAIAEAYLGLAHIHRDQADLPTAIATAQQAQALLDEIGNVGLQRDAHEVLYNLYKQAGNFEQALAHHEAFTRYKDQLFNEASDQRMRQLQVRHQTQVALQEAEFERQRRLEIERQREQDRAMFEWLTQLKQDAIDHTSHDLKTPLSVLNVTLELMRRKNTDPQLLPYMQRLQNATKQMSTLITDLLDLARMKTGRTLMLEPITLQQVVQDVIEGLVPLAEAKAIAMRFVHPEVPVTAQVDRQGMHQVLRNLLSNALQYTPQGGSITVNCMTEAENIVLSVRDTGIGIPPESLPHIFDRFYRAQNANETFDNGTGLGLAIVKAVVEQHNGQIDVQSSVGKGTTMTLRLPQNPS